MAQRIDCKKAEVDCETPPCRCKWCGRRVKRTYLGKVVHRAGQRRMWPDPRKAAAK